MDRFWFILSAGQGGRYCRTGDSNNSCISRAPHQRAAPWPLVLIVRLIHTKGPFLPKINLSVLLFLLMADTDRNLRIYQRTCVLAVHRLITASATVTCGSQQVTADGDQYGCPIESGRLIHTAPRMHSENAFAWMSGQNSLRFLLESHLGLSCTLHVLLALVSNFGRSGVETRSTYRSYILRTP